jgi:hypothetical protein
MPNPVLNPTDPQGNPISSGSIDPSTGKPLGQPGTVSQPTPTGSYGQFVSGFSSLPYANSPAFQALLQGFGSDPNRTLPNPNAIGQWQSIIKGYGDTFASQFQNLAGRAPTADEYNTFFSQVINPMQPWNKTPDQAAINTDTQGLLANTFSGTIADAQTQKGQQQANAATAENPQGTASPFDVWQTSLTNSTNSLDSQLQDYQARLFEKIRPQLLTSLQSQGLLDTGALNTAFAGAASDLTNAEQGYVANAKQQNAQTIANQKYAIQSSPSNTALQNTFSTIPNLTSSGQTALNNAFSNYMQTNASNLAYNNQLNFMNAYQANQPSLLSQYGGQILGGTAAGLAQKKW